MTYSCSDFTDDVFAELVRVSAISATEAADDELDDNPSLQGTYALAGIERLVDARDALARYRASVADFLTRHGMTLNDGALCAADDHALQALTALGCVAAPQAD